MKPTRYSRRWRRWARWMLLFGTPWGGLAASRDVAEEPRWMRLNITEAKISVESEGEFEQTQVKSDAAAISRDLVYVVPTMGLGVRGSVYHSNLFQYDLNAEGGVGWQEYRLDVPGQGAKTGLRDLQRYHAMVSLLKEKPFAVNFFADKERNTRDYDFFTRARVDSQRAGASAGYAEGPVPFRITAGQSEEHITGLANPMTYKDNTLNFTASNERRQGSHTDISYDLDQYHRQETGYYNQEGIYHSANLRDMETFGRDDWVNLRTTMLYTRLDQTNLPSSSFSASELVTLRHSQQLETTYNYDFNQRDTGPVENQGHNGIASIRHRLYESLVSTFDVHAQSFSSQSPDTKQDTTRYGLGLNESYTKKLGDWGRLNLGYSIRADQEDRETLGQFIIVVGEAHTLKDGELTFLHQTGIVRSSIRVTDPSGAIVYHELLDYLILPSGEQTEIQRVAGGKIPNGAAVMVDYTALRQPSDSYQVLANYLQLRLDLFNGLLGLYGRANFVDNFGGESLILQNIADRVAGADITWRWLKAGAEYEDFDSNLSPYHAQRLFQTLRFELTESSALTFDFSQRWLKHTDNGLGQNSYDFIGRYNWRLGTRVAFNAEGGMRITRGFGYDQDLATARTDFDFHFGKLDLRTGYEFQDDNFLGELRTRHYFFVRATRKF